MRGGIIFGVYALFFIFLMALEVVQHSPKILNISLVILSVPFWAYGVWLCGIGGLSSGVLLNCNTSPLWNFIYQIPMIILFFILGALIGWIYGKIKNSKKSGK